MNSTTTKFLPLALAALAACADGGKEDRPQSEVKFTASHHFFGFRSLRGFGAFPVDPDVVFTDRGRLNLFDDSSYTLTRSSGTTAADQYALETTGVFSLLVSGTSVEPSVVFVGGYGLVPGAPATNADLFFTDRVSTPNSQSLGLYVGTRVVNGQVELEGNWHLLSLHAIFGQTILAPENVGRAAHGSVNIAAGAAGTSRTISGTGFQGSTQGPIGLTFGGTIQNLLTSGAGDGTCNLTLNYGADARIVLAVATGNTTAGSLVLGLDADESDGEAGLVFMVRKFDAPGAPVDSVRVPGRFLVGGHTLFVNPTNSGSDAFIGVVTLTAPDGFRLEGTGNQGTDFTYQGTYTLSAEGGITITVNGTNETWFAAIDRGYNTLLFVDDFVELRANNIPELNIGFGVREKT